MFVTITIARDDKMGIATGGAYLMNALLGIIALFGVIYHLPALLSKNDRKMSLILISVAILIMGLTSFFSDFKSAIFLGIAVIAFSMLLFCQSFVLWKLKRDRILFLLFSLIVAILTYSISLTDLKFRGEYEPENWEYSYTFQVIAILNILGFAYTIVQNRFKLKSKNKTDKNVA